jgi:exodeoxyribonuclease III
MRLTTWNVNGLRSAIGRGFGSWLLHSNHDVVCLQEVRLQYDLLMDGWFESYDSYWSTASRPGYSGVATLVRSGLQPVGVHRGVLDGSSDSEGRVLTTEFKDFILVNAYAPNSQPNLARLEYKLHFCQHLLGYVHGLRRSGKPLIVVGDLNVAHKEIDVSKPEEHKRSPGFSLDERQWMSDLLNDGLVDTFRMFTAAPGHYTWWSSRNRARERNIGWRLDYILVDESLSRQVRSCVHSTEQEGSDHCPVTMHIDI